MVVPETILAKGKTKEEIGKRNIFIDVLSPYTEQQDGDGNSLYGSPLKLRVTAEVYPFGIQKVTAGEECLILNEDGDFTGDDKGWEIQKKEGNLVTKICRDFLFEEDGNGQCFTVEITDREGITTKREYYFSIDTKEPEVIVAYDNQEYMETMGTRYFTKGRKADVTVVEENFSKEKMEIQLYREDIREYFPVPAEWKMTEENTYRAEISFTEDGSYQWQIKGEDRAGNQTETGFFDTFVIDSTPPVAVVSFQEEKESENAYYSNKREAVITVTEKNFEEEAVRVCKGSLDMQMQDTKVECKWEHFGEIHKTKVLFDKDGAYTLSVKGADLAGNFMEEYKKERFVIDTKKPEVEIRGIKDESANGGEVLIGILWQDENMEGIPEILLKGSKTGERKVEGTFTGNAASGEFEMNAFLAEKGQDDRYELIVRARDRAQNAEEKKIRFSVNRFGSAYTLEKETEQLNGTYRRHAQDVKIKEVNVDSLILESILVKVAQGNLVRELKEGTDYTVEKGETEEGENSYLYTIKKEIFEQEDVYALTIQSKDRAGNVNENREAEIRFGIDRTKPTVFAGNIQDKGVYKQEELEADFLISDNFLLKETTFWLNGEETEADERNGRFFIKIPGSKKPQNVKIRAVDEAGNRTYFTVKDFYVMPEALKGEEDKQQNAILPAAVFALAGGILFILFLNRQFIRKKSRNHKE